MAVLDRGSLRICRQLEAVLVSSPSFDHSREQGDLLSAGSDVRAAGGQVDNDCGLAAKKYLCPCGARPLLTKRRWRKGAQRTTGPSCNKHSPIASQPKPRKSLNERKYPPHDASHQSMFCASKSPLRVRQFCLYLSVRATGVKALSSRARSLARA